METIVPANPAQTLAIDPAKLASYRASYRFMSYVLEERGQKMRDDLPGIDRPEGVTRLYSLERRLAEERRVTSTFVELRRWERNVIA